MTASSATQDATATSIDVWQWTRNAWGLFLPLLIGTTWRLWIPEDTMPRLPASSLLTGVSQHVAWPLLILLVVGLGIAFTKRWYRPGARIVVLALGGLLLLDQLCWQPWALQAWIMACVFAWGSAHHGLRLLRLLTLAIYLHSALSKIDYLFTQTLGQQLLAVLGSWTGLDIDAWPPQVRTLVPLAVPAVELVVCVLLVFRRTRRIGVAVAVLMHGATIALLGPWGLGHEHGVLLWNLFFAVQVVLLFWFTQQTRQGEESEAYTTGDYGCSGLVVVAALFPFLSYWGWWDTWPSWALYAPRGERVEVLVHELAAARLPESLREHLAGEPPWHHLRLDRWSIAERSAPLYPQNRARIALAKAIADRYQIQDLVRLEVQTAANPRTGVREARIVEGREALRRETERYWLGTQAVW